MLFAIIQLQASVYLTDLASHILKSYFKFIVLHHWLLVCKLLMLKQSNCFQTYMSHWIFPKVNANMWFLNILIPCSDFPSIVLVLYSCQNHMISRWEISLVKFYAFFFYMLLHALTNYLLIALPFTDYWQCRCCKRHFNRWNQTCFQLQITCRGIISFIHLLVICSLIRLLVNKLSLNMVQNALDYKYIVS